MAAEVVRIYLHDGAFRRIGEITTAADVDRSYVLEGVPQATLTVDEDEPLLSDLDPRQGRALVIESTAYPEPWVGKVTSLRHRRREGLLEVRATGYAGILGQRPLGVPAHYEGTVGRIFQRIIADANAVNGTGITVGEVEQGPYREEDYPDTMALAALDDLTAKAGMEWWLDVNVEERGIDITARLATARGMDVTATAALVDGGNGEWSGWLIDGEASSFALTVVGGQGSVVGTYTERPRARQVAAGGEGFVTADGGAGASILAPHGYVPETGASATSPLTRRERLEVAESLKSRDLVGEAARVLLARGPVAERVAELEVWRVDADGNDVSWADFRVGNVIALRLPGAFLDGYEGPARIVGVQPDEADGILTLAVHLVQRVVE